MTPEPEIRLRCPKCGHLRKGFSAGGSDRPQWFTAEKVCFTMECMECHHVFYAFYTYTEQREKMSEFRTLIPHIKLLANAMMKLSDALEQIEPYYEVNQNELFYPNYLMEHID